MSVAMCRVGFYMHHSLPACWFAAHLNYAADPVADDDV